MSSNGYGEAVEQALGAEIEIRQTRSPRDRERVWASGFHPCLRRMVLDMAEGAKRPDFDLETKARFELGRSRERALNMLLDAAGERSRPPFRVQAIEDRVELRDRHRRVVLSGRVDGALVFDDGGIMDYDIKSWHPNIAEGVRTFEDALQGEWTRGAAHQLGAYMVAREHEQGALVLDRRGLPRLVVATIDDVVEPVERFWAMAEEAVEWAGEYRELAEAHEEDKTVALPPFTEDRRLCRRCWCNGVVCFPPSGRAKGAAILTDPEILQEVAEQKRDEDMFGEAAKRMAKREKRLKDLFKPILLEHPEAIVGDYVVTAQFRQYTKTALPQAVKAKIDAMSKPYRFTDPKGQMRDFEIVRVSPFGDGDGKPVTDG